MKKGKLKYNKARWPALIGTFSIGCLGLFMIYIALFDAGSISDSADAVRDGTWFIGGLGFLFAVMGISSSIHSFFTSVAYRRKSQLGLDELDSHTHYDNGLVIVFSGWAKMLSYKHQDIVDRGYIYVTEELNRKKKVITWHFRVD